jgi:chorismate mutase/prephenate dehydratase
VPAGTRCKTSLWLELEHRPGALGEVLACFSRHRVNLTKIESRPGPGEAWRYRFFLDVEGTGEEDGLERALEEIRPLSSALRSLGTYPAAEKG